ncbi:MAG: hypothetical protein JKX72_02040 [Robiginitomaculum sp.]|nr:hypothetical protein [Robiginitomaculum sp.]
MIIFDKLLKYLLNKLPTLRHIKIPGKNFESLSNFEFASMIHALYTEGGNDDFDQWALLEFHLIRKFKPQKIQDIWDNINVIFYKYEEIDEQRLHRREGWDTKKGKIALLAYAAKLSTKNDVT